MREAAIAAVYEAPLGSVVTISPPPQSWEQQKKMWAMLHDISRAKPLGRDLPAESWKFIMMRALGYETQFELDLQGRPFPVGMSSKDLGKKGTSDLIEFMYAFGAEHNVQWTEPE